MSYFEAGCSYVRIVYFLIFFLATFQSEPNVVQCCAAPMTPFNVERKKADFSVLEIALRVKFVIKEEPSGS